MEELKRKIQKRIKELRAINTPMARARIKILIKQLAELG